MKHYTDFIMKHRKWIIGMFLVAAVICAILSKMVGVNYNFADYLPDDSKSSKDLEVMEEEYEQAIPNLRVLIYDVSIAEALNYKQQIADIDGVDEIQWLDDAINIYAPLETAQKDTIDTWYKDGNALFSVTVDENKKLETVNAVREIIGDDNSMSGTAEYQLS